MPNLVHVRDRRRQRVRSPLRRRRAVRRDRPVSAARAASSSVRWSTRSSPPMPTGSYDLSSFRGKRGNPAFDAWVQPDDVAWGRNAGGYGQTEVMGMATFNLLGVGRHRHARPAVAARRRARRRRRRSRRCGAGEVGEIVGARRHRDERLLEPARAERARGRATAGTTRTISGASRPTARSRSSGPRRACSSRRPRTSIRSRSRTASRRTPRSPTAR